MAKFQDTEEHGILRAPHGCGGPIAFDDNVSAAVAKLRPQVDALMARATGRTKRVRLPWWKAILRWRRYEDRPMTVMELMVERDKLEVEMGMLYNEMAFPRLTDDRNP